MDNQQNSRNAEFAENPGEYRLAVRPSETEIAPGKDVNLEIYITGYGKIHSAKVIFYPPQSFVLGLIPTQANIGRIHVETGARARYWFAFFEGDDAFADVRHQPLNIIASEIGRGYNPPLRLPLRTRRTIPTGIHSLQFFLTYFNGSEWKTDSQSVSIAVPNWFRRHEGFTWVAGVSAVVITLLSLALDIADKWDIFQGFLQLFIEVPILGAAVIVLLCVGIPLTLYWANIGPMRHS